MRPDFRQIKLMKQSLQHSAKGSEWEKHKYIKRIDGSYYYPDNYEGGRHLSDSKTNKDSKESEKTKEDSNKLDLSSDDITKLANEVIRGNFGNGQTRKDLLGDNYQEVQDKVNEIMKSQIGLTKISEVNSDSVKKGEEIIKKSVEKITQASKGLSLEQVYNVYRNKKN